MQRPLFLYDGGCPFCCRWVARWREATGDRVEYAPAEDAAARAPHVAPERFEQSSILVEPDGRTSFGAEAALRALSYAPRGGKLLWAYTHVPGFAAVAEAAYALVASNRRLFSLFTRVLYGRDVTRPRYALVRWAFLRGIGVVHLIAFLSLWVQAEGLWSSRGILPVQPWLDAIAPRVGSRPYMQVPTLFWISGSDAALHVVCAGGVAASLLLIANVLPGPASVVAWACYLSLYVIGRVFLTFQWDILLLESGVIAALWAPWRLRPRVQAPASKAPLWLARWLAARLMFLSGAVKLLSHDPAWRDLTAMSYHYETQPLPAWTSWYMQQLPLAFHRAETAMMFAIELGLPVLVFLPRRPRLVAFAGFIALQLMIGLTGNYGFFNILTAVICLSLLDDAYLASVLPAGLVARSGTSTEATRERTVSGARILVRVGVGAAAAFLFSLSAGNFAGRIFGYDRVPLLVRRWLVATDQYQLTNNYGLFAVMTKERPEIVVEGSDDGESWKAYEFRWKPGDVARQPRFVQPHMPRLDWQMWFAALGNYRQNAWFMSFMQRLLEASPPVLALLAHDPFDGRAPRYVRATVYEYHFTRMGQDDPNAWWKRAEPRAYAPVLQRREP